MIGKIKENYDLLRKSEKKVAMFLLEYEGDVRELTTKNLAKCAEVSEPTIIRFAQAIGFKSFKELKLWLIEESIKKQVQTEHCCDAFYGYPLSPIDKLERVPEIIVDAISGQLERSVRRIDIKVLQTCIETILSSKKILICGVENSAATASDLNTKLTYLGLQCNTYEDQYIKYINACNLTNDDLVIGISYGGYAKETLDVLKVARVSGAKTIGITNFTESVIKDYVDLVIEVSSEQFLYGNAVFSRATQLAVVDMIYTGIILTDYEYYTKKIDETCRIINKQVYET